MFRADHEDKLEKLFMEKSKNQEGKNFAEWVCGDEVTKACKDVDPRTLKKPEFFMDGKAMDPSMITMGYGSNTKETPDL